MNKYLTDFVKDHGGDNIFASKIGITRQAIGNLKRGKHRAKEKVILSIEENFSDFDRMQYFMDFTNREMSSQGMSILSKNLQLIIDIETDGNIHKFSNEYLGEERSDKLRAWIKGIKDPNLNEIDKFIQSLKNNTGRYLSLNWLVYNVGEMFISKEKVLLDAFSARFNYLLNNYEDKPIKIPDLAKRLNYAKIDTDKLNQYESGHSEPKAENLRQLKMVFPLVNLNWLIAGVGEFKETKPTN